MTKRFTIEIIEDKDVFIHQDGAMHFLGVNGYVNGGMVVDLLNNLYDENEQLKQSFINLIDKKIEEFKNGDYGDLPCNTIHMFLDLKEEL